jgi:endogenous inhibitor of DNA gyrase (YacG/DUF329 family)
LKVTIMITTKKTYNCIHCGNENGWKRTSHNKFCNNACQAAYKWITETVPRIERGECTHNSSGTLKKYLTETRGEHCEDCGIGSIWNGKPLVLQLDHIDGDSDNNHLKNLRLLCPNCHTQTETFGSKGQGNRYKKQTARNVYLQQYKGRLAQR